MKYNYQLPYEKPSRTQFGEWGIIELMLAGLRDPQHTFVEIGFGTGDTNMTMDLLDRGYSGVGIDARDWDPGYSNQWGDRLTKIQSWVWPNNVLDLVDAKSSPDFFSLDIDSFDYEIAGLLLQQGFRPAVVCCEINKHFYNQLASFPCSYDTAKYIYDRKFIYGCSLPKYQSLWSQYGYQFFTFNTGEVNAFWYDPSRVTMVDGTPTLQTLDPKDTEVIRQKISQHWYWGQRIEEIYQS